MAEYNKEAVEKAIRKDKRIKKLRHQLFIDCLKGERVNEKEKIVQRNGNIRS